ncbi:ATP-dependent DNA helicase Q4 [Aplysia californica]|uniref:ATP-dependent DNA helicase Q4 n=1 Tax=Aplysia californica TaxID=6500 RepID=A0ABM1VQJ9_APLCA|nr:ATP-dependent DNA helicase Q4 [Aplysia californica]
MSGDCEDIHSVRKALKQWESAFYIVHRRKPDRNDINQAPVDIQDKYRHYNDLKRRSSSSSSQEVSQKPTTSKDDSSGGVWGVELNKKPVTTDSETSSTGSKSDSLHKLGAKLFKSFEKQACHTASHEHRNNKGLKKSLSRTLPQGTASGSKEKQAAVDDRNSFGKSSSSNVLPVANDRSQPTVGDAGGDDVCSDDFVIKSGIFGAAGKALSLSSREASRNQKPHSKPRRSFLTASVKLRPEDTDERGSTPSENVEENFKFQKYDVDNDNEFITSSSAGGSSGSFRMVTSNLDKSQISNSREKSGENNSSDGKSDIFSSIKNVSVTPKDLNLDVCPEKFVSAVHSSAVCSKSLDKISTAEESLDAVCNAESRLKTCERVTQKTKVHTNWITKRAADSNECNMVEPVDTLVHTSRQTRKRKNSGDERQTADGPVHENSTPGCGKSVQEEDSHLDIPDSSGAGSSKVKKKTTAAASATRKRSAASMNENYVCLNMKKKGYRRKGAGMTGSQLRKKQWKAKMAARSQSYGSNKCFKCGQEGHWANKCKGKAKMGKDLDPSQVDKSSVDEADFPSLREAAMMSCGVKESASVSSAAAPDDISDIEAAVIREREEDPAPPAPPPVFSSVADDVTGEMRTALDSFGFADFRPGQEHSITRILQGKSLPWL